MRAVRPLRSPLVFLFQRRRVERRQAPCPSLADGGRGPQEHVFLWPCVLNANPSRWMHIERPGVGPPVMPDSPQFAVHTHRANLEGVFVWVLGCEPAPARGFSSLQVRPLVRHQISLDLTLLACKMVHLACCKDETEQLPKPVRTRLALDKRSMWCPALRFLPAPLLTQTRLLNL